MIFISLRCQVRNRSDREQIITNNIAVIEQDFDICLTTHQNYLSGGYQPGPLSPRHEKGVHFFSDVSERRNR